MAKNTKTLLDDDARKAILQGVNAVYEPTKRTLGPHGRSALVPRTYNRGQLITDDGVTVAEWQEPKDPHVRIVAETFKEMCKRTVEKVGDATTTTAVIGGHLYNAQYPKLLTGKTSMMARGSTSAVELKNLIIASAEKVKAAILERKTDISSLEDLERIAIVSVKDEKLGKTIAQMAWEVGVDGFIDTTEGYKGVIETEVTKGMRFQSKVAAKAFVNNPSRYEMSAQDCPVLITNFNCDSGSKIAHVLSKLNERIGKIIIIAPSFADNVLVGMVEATKAGYFIYPVAAPGLRTEQFEDLAIYCGADFIDKAKGKSLEDVRYENLGFVEKLVVKDTDQREEAVILGGRGLQDRHMSVMADGERKVVIANPVAERIEVLKGQMAEQKQEIYKKLFERRIASMASGVGVIRVGASTDAEVRFLMKKVEDCVYACKAALRGGYVKGGGLCLKEIAEDILPEDDILRESLIYPYQLIQASVPGGVTITEDIIDAAEAVYWSVEHATQIVAKLITVDVVTAEIEATDPGDAAVMSTRMLGEIVLAVKQYLGLIRENELEMERDRLGGLTAGEKVMLDNG
jgi:chaperonin GroEL